jgi:hypothetical protein
MSSWLQFCFDVLLAEAKFSLRILAIYLLPWAKACDWLSMRLVIRRHRLQPFLWHISAYFLCTIVAAHCAFFWWLAPLRYLENGGHADVPPCVCEAMMQHVMHTHALIRRRTGNLVIDLWSIQCSLSLLFFQCLSLIADCLNHVLANPVFSTIVVTVGVVIRHVL